MSSKHDGAAQRIAAKNRTSYNQGQGPDVKAQGRTIEVETRNTVNDGKRQLQGFRGPVYIAGADQQATQRAAEATRGTTIGVMNSRGQIVKQSTRRRR